MFKLGKASTRKLNTVHADLQTVLIEAIATSKIDFSIIWGHRGEKAQNAAVAAGNSPLLYPRSKHNKLPSLAFDVAPYYSKNPHIRWQETSDFKKLGKHIMATAKKLDIHIRWGHDWDEDGKLGEKGEFDMPHFEIMEPST